MRPDSVRLHSEEGCVSRLQRGQRRGEAGFRNHFSSDVYSFETKSRQAEGAAWRIAPSMSTLTDNDLPSFNAMFQPPLRRILDPVEPVFERLFAVDQLRQTLETVRGMPGGGDAVARLLAALGITWEAGPAELERIPRTGALLVVANHPFGLLEGAVLANALPAVRPDVRILANSLLAGVAELRQWCIYVNPFGARESVGENARALREASAWLRSGGALVVFPAGEVAHFDWRTGTLADPAWRRASRKTPVPRRYPFSSKAPTASVFNWRACCTPGCGRPTCRASC
jgi:putative hemolysin